MKVIRHLARACWHVVIVIGLLVLLAGVMTWNILSAWNDEWSEA